MPRTELLAVGRLPPGALAELEESFRVHQLWLAENPREFLLAIRERVAGIVVGAHGSCPAELIGQLPHLKVISVFGVGYDSVDVEAAKSRQIPVSNTPDVLTDDVADLALGLLLCVIRRLPQADAYVRAGRWLTAAMPLTGRLAGRTLGVVGMGRIGRAIACRAQAFRLEVFYHGPHEKSDLPYRYFPDLVALAKDVDILLLAAPGGAATRHLVDAAVLAALGSDGVLINIARGSLVDEAALVTALQTGALGGAGLDVFADEPRVPAELMQLENVVLLPHVGSATVETREAMSRLFLDNVYAIFAGRPLLTPVY